ncbi:MAG: fasciclin domain-containing protein [Actinomycetota bacterium]
MGRRRTLRTFDSLVVGTISISNRIPANIEACNGIVHVIDTVLIPIAPEPPAPSILEIATTAGLTNLIDAVIAASGGDINFAAAVADCTSDLTVFAPTNEAFDAIADVAAGLTIEQLQTVIAYHVTAGAQTGADLAAAGTTPTLAGIDLTVTTNAAGDVIIQGLGSTALVIGPNIEACNGIVHVIDTVLIPIAPEPPAVIADGNTVQLLNVDRQRTLDGNRNGSVVLDPTPELDDQWILEDAGDGTWLLRNAQYDRYLDADRRRGYIVDMTRSAHAFGVRWEIIPQADGNYVLRNVDFNRYLDGDRSGRVDTSRTIRHDDIWQITLIDAG